LTVNANCIKNRIMKKNNFLFRNNIILLFTILILFRIESIAQTTIKIQSSDYHNETIVFWSYSDYVTFDIDTISVVKTNENGAFSFKIKENKISQIHTFLGVYHLVFYIDPSQKNYEFIFPPKKDKSKAEELNPYFEMELIRLVAKSEQKEELNRLIKNFDEIYNDFLIRKYDSIVHYPQFKVVSKFETKINNYYSEVNQMYFKNYIFYKLNEIKFYGPNRDRNYMVTNYFDNPYPILYYNVAYMNLFNILFEDYFVQYNNRFEVEELENLIQYSRSPSKIKELIKSKERIQSDEILELVILKGIHDELFHSKPKYLKRFPRPQLHLILDSMVILTQHAEIKKIANQIIKKKETILNKLPEKVPNLILTNREGKEEELYQYHDKLIYLNFMRSDLHNCIEDMDRLKAFYSEHEKNIEVVTVFTDETIDFVSKIDTTIYKWPIYHIGKSRNLLENFNLITWPQYHLIGKEGKIMLTPAPSLQEGFEIKVLSFIAKEPDKKP